jgi:hypothetical protein
MRKKDLIAKAKDLGLSVTGLTVTEIKKLLSSTSGEEADTVDENPVSVDDASKEELDGDVDTGVKKPINTPKSSKKLSQTQIRDRSHQQVRRFLGK